MRVCLFVLLIGIAGNAWPNDVPDVRLLVDVSGSMRTNDPNNLRKPALRMLGGLLPEDSRFGVALFGTRAQWIVTPKGRIQAVAELDAASQSIHARDRLTDIEGALRFATQGWQTSASGQKILILLTDGQVDVEGDEEADRTSRDNILKQLLPELKRQGVRIYTIALSRDADAVLLKGMSNSTKAWFAFAETASDMQQAFLKIFEQFSATPQVPLEGNAFKIDRSVKEFTALIFKKNNRSITLIDPAGNAYEVENAGKGMHWYSDVGFELITVRDPAAGVWKVQGPVDPDNRVMVLSDLRLDVNNDELPANLLAGDELTLKVALKEKAYVIKRPNFLRLVQFAGTVSTVPGETFELLLTDDGTDGDEKAHDGVFSYLIQAPRKDAEISLKVEVKSPTFARVYRRSMRVYATFYGADLLPSETPEQPHRIVALAREAVVDPDNLNLQGELESEDGQKKADLAFTRQDDGSFVADIPSDFPPGVAKLTMYADGRTLFDRQFKRARLQREIEVPPPVVNASEPSETPSEEQEAIQESVSVDEGGSAKEQEASVDATSEAESGAVSTETQAEPPTEALDTQTKESEQASEEKAADEQDAENSDTSEPSQIPVWWWVVGGLLFNALVFGGGFFFWRKWQAKTAEEQASLAASLDASDSKTDTKQE